MKDLILGFVNWIKKKWLWIILPGLIFILGILIPLLINQSYKSNDGYITLWGAADVLAYYGAFLGGFGTIFLGSIAWQQNKRLLKIEENTFIANNACMGFIHSIVFSNTKRKIANLELHDEQIVSADDVREIANYASFSIEVEMKIESNVAALVKINSLSMGASLNEISNQKILDLQGNDKSFSRVALSHEGIKFNIGVIVKPEDKKDFLTIIDNQSSKIFIELDFILLSDKYVSTHLKCRSSLECHNYSNKEEIYNEFKGESPLCFWYGNDIFNKEMVSVKDIKS